MKTLATMQITPVGGEPEGKKVGEFRKYKEVLQSASVPIPNKEVVKPPLNGKQVGRPQTVRRHQALSRTSSAPVNIPRRRADAIRRGKKNLARVSSSSGVPGISPGGTHRIIYDREFLMECRESPLSQTPPTDLPQIPGATCPRERRPRNKKNLLEKVDSTASTSSFVSQTSSSCSVDEARHELESFEL